MYDRTSNWHMQSIPKEEDVDVRYYGVVYKGPEYLGDISIIKCYQKEDILFPEYPYNLYDENTMRMHVPSPTMLLQVDMGDSVFQDWHSRSIRTIDIKYYYQDKFEQTFNNCWIYSVSNNMRHVYYDGELRVLWIAEYYVEYISGMKRDIK